LSFVLVHHKSGLIPDFISVFTKSKPFKALNQFFGGSCNCVHIAGMSQINFKVVLAQSTIVALLISLLVELLSFISFLRLAGLRITRGFWSLVIIILAVAIVWLQTHQALSY